MLARLALGDVRYVVAYDQSRITRNVGDLQRFREAIAQAGTLFIESSTGRVLDPDDEDQELGSNVIGSVDQHYRRKLARRVRDALATKDSYSAWSMLSEPWRARQGYPDFAGGYRTTLSTQFDPVSTTVLSPASARVLGTVTALDVLPETPAGFAERTVFSGSYTVDHAAGRWGIVEADMRRLSLVRVRR